MSGTAATWTSHKASLELPADAAFVATARIFAASLARHFAVEEDRIDDLKLAISEACGLFIRAGDEVIRVDVEPAAGELRFEASGPALPPAPENDDTPSTPSDFAARTAAELIGALFAESEIVTDGQRSVVRFSVHRAKD